MTTASASTVKGVAKKLDYAAWGQSQKDSWSGKGCTKECKTEPSVYEQILVKSMKNPVSSTVDTQEDQSHSEEAGNTNTNTNFSYNTLPDDLPDQTDESTALKQLGQYKNLV